MDEIYILDTETTGLKGYSRGEKVVEISICKVDLKTNEITLVYDEVVGHNIDNWSHKNREAWIFQNTNLELSHVAKAYIDGKTEEVVVEEVRNILRDQWVTAFNVSYDFGKFLYGPPWGLKEIVHMLPCLMKTCSQYTRIPNRYGGGYKWPNLDEASFILLKDEKLQNQIQKMERHRAASDTLISSMLFVYLYNAGKFPL